MGTTHRCRKLEKMEVMWVLTVLGSRDHVSGTCCLSLVLKTIPTNISWCRIHFKSFDFRAYFEN